MPEISNSNTAIVIVACRDFEALEVGLACHIAFGSDDIPIIILQNCAGSFDAEYTLKVARRYQRLYPNRITVADTAPAGNQYLGISNLLKSDLLAQYDYILKVDDDAFPISSGWVEQMQNAWRSESQEHGEKLAYVTPLINNNCWGFKRMIEIMGIEEEYFADIARDHFVGNGSEKFPKEFRTASQIDIGAHGTIWGSPEIARWVHEKSTLQPGTFIAACKDLGIVPVPSHERYSIGAILFRKQFYFDIDDQSEKDKNKDDEGMMHAYCSENNMRIACLQSVPFVHLAFYAQREDNRDVTQRVSKFYDSYLNMTYSIRANETQQDRIEARLRYLDHHKSRVRPSIVRRIKTRLRSFNRRP